MHVQEIQDQQTEGTLSSDGPLWYKDAVIYELHVRSFFDSNNDGIGDFKGLIQKLDYLKDLGITAIWILPFYPSPLKDDGYDIADYNSVNPSYGDMRDVRRFVREAQKRGLKVITELVCNHTSDQHPWFQRARRAKPGSVYRDFYVWNDDDEKYKEARIIFKDFEASNWSWDPVAQAYYWHRFYHHQPDLNFDNPRVHDAVIKAMDFWFDMGIDGLRLDAIPYLYEREGTNCENLPETHAFLKKLRAHVDSKYENRLLLAEANQWPEDSVEYFGDGDECHMAFHFPVMPRLFMAVRMEDRYPIIDILEQTPEIPENAQWAMFLRNHDELTLEMVTDEERDYMYRVYAHDHEARINLGIRRRLAPLLGNNRRRIELMNGLLFSLPGTPVLYYGDEIGMGDNIFLGDRNGVRTPMQWSGDRNAGFSTANRQRLYFPVVVDPEYHYETINVDVQQNNPQSLLWWMKRIIDLRQRYKAFGRGTIEFLHPDNRKVLAYVRRFEDETILVVANLSRFVQAVELDLSEYNGWIPTELFGSTDFPAIGELPYFITLGPHSFYYFSLEPSKAFGDQISIDHDMLEAPPLTVSGSWESLLSERHRQSLMTILPTYLRTRRWFGGKARRIKGVSITETIPVQSGDFSAQLVMLQVDYTDGDPEHYLLPLAFASGDQLQHVEEWLSHAVVSRLNVRGGVKGILYDAVWEPAFATALLDMIARRRSYRGDHGALTSATTRQFRQLRGPSGDDLPVSVSRAEQSNSSIMYGDRLILKLFRRMEQGENPDLEIGRFLTEQTSFENIAPVAGSIEYTRDRQPASTVGILQAYVENEGDAWQFTLDTLSTFFEEALATELPPDTLIEPRKSLLDLAQEDLPDLANQQIGAFIEEVYLLGQRTAEMHRALASNRTDSAFAPESFSMLYQRSVYQSMRSQAGRVFQVLKRQAASLPDDTAAEANEVLALEGEVRSRFQSIIGQRIHASRTRIHGDYHLGQVLFTGRDFVIIDFEGEPARPVGERRIKRSPLADVAGMLRSFHYAAFANLFDQGTGVPIRPGDVHAVERWAQFWNVWVSAAYLKAYMEHAEGATFMPENRDEVQILLDVFLLDKAVYELGYELNNRPEWVRIPLHGILDVIRRLG
jgi:maltose alpha-D-glucosyltransferase / alpha-amylase